MDAVGNTYYGIDESDCPLPCEIFSTDTRLTASENYKKVVGFALTFNQNVEVKTDKFIQDILVNT